ncbi:hypothetical protein [Streptomyces europaeiscabiei]|uniref:hypothetical protein n=1 Tax=Streptomyces europaeiscabiei TaxID=146819 RepID=UPI0029B1FBDC|nr:hypothetical protein [Streptomyces europaeiscabiei]MDX3775938.1 hypothetical protein [Streptomyces europaeiscabiei]
MNTQAGAQFPILVTAREPTEENLPVMSDVIPFDQAIKNAAEIFVRATVIRDFLPSRIAAELAHSPGGPSVDELEAKIISRRDASISTRVRMIQGDRRLFGPSEGGTSVASAIDRAAEAILHERGHPHAAAESASAAPRRRRRPSRQAADFDEEERLPEMAFMTPREVAEEVWRDGLGVESIDALEALISNELKARLETARRMP